MGTLRRALGTGLLLTALGAATIVAAPVSQAGSLPTVLPAAADTAPPYLVPMPPGFNDGEPHFTASYHTIWSQYADDGAGVASTDTRIRSAARGALGFGAYVYPARWQAQPGSFASPIPLGGPLRTGITYCVSTRARDLAGNVSAWSSDFCTSQLGDEAGNSLNGLDAHWRTTSNCTIYFSCSILRSTVRGAYAIGTTGSTVSGRRFAFLVTTCSTCGRFAVYVGSTKLGDVDTYSPIKHNQRVIELPYHSYVRGYLKVVVVTNGKQVLIDGFGYRI